VKSKLNVNPDGTLASYTAGDHGFTYIINGVDLYENNQRKSCQTTKEVQLECRQKFLDAERSNFGPGTAEFCSYAIEVEATGPSKITCGGGRYLFGNGKGRPKADSPVSSVSGQAAVPYVSMTALRHTVAGNKVYLDSMIVPTMVLNGNYERLQGHVAWVRSRPLGNSLLAVTGDAGGKLGEASISVHQILRYGMTKPPPPTGPIPVGLRCSAVENELQPPFESRPDAPTDKCKPGYIARSQSDIRAYTGINGGVEMIVLGRARFDRTGNVVKTEVSKSSLQKLFDDSGYTQSEVDSLAACLN
jgi:hypothetical protein